jgi:hypothetical protein
VTKANQENHKWRAQFPLRTVHLDFHVGPAVPDVGKDFDGDAFARTFHDAHVDSVTVFAKCHHGLLYYATQRPERHPGLVPGLDLLGGQIEALHGAGIRAPIYLSVQCDEYAANEHPEWLALGPDLRQVRRPAVGAYEAGWQILDMSSPYADYLGDQLAEVLGLYGPVDGIFLDMCWDQPSSSRWAMAGMRAEGLDPASTDDRDRYARLVAHRYMRRYASQVDAALVAGSATGVWFNSRPKASLTLEREFVRHIEVEALPTGGWGYNYLPYVGRLVRSLGLPALSHTGRFHRSWGDTASLKCRSALSYECAQILAHGLSNGVGDFLPPSGKLDAAAYTRIESVFGHIAACEAITEGTRHVSDIALIVDTALGDHPGDAVIGAVRVLQQLRHQFDVLARDASLAGYPLVVVPETTSVDPGLARRLLSHVDAGGALLIEAGSVPHGPDGDAFLASLGAERHGVLGYTTLFLDLSGSPLEKVSHEIDIRVHGAAHKLRCLEGTDVVVGLIEPYFERNYDHFSGHAYTPPGQPSAWGAVLRHGSVILVGVPLLAAVAAEGNEEYRTVLRALIDEVLPHPLVRAGGPVHLETTVLRAASHTAVHLLSFVPSRLAHDLDLVNDPFPIVDVEVAVRVERPPSRVRLEPSGTALPFHYADGYTTSRVTVLDGHAILVVDD